MRKIHVTRQLFEASGRQGDFSEKTITRFQMRSMGVCVPNSRSVSLLMWPGSVTQTNEYTKNTYTQVNLRISSTGCSPHVDSEKKLNPWTYIFYLKSLGTVFLIF